MSLPEYSLRDLGTSGASGPGPGSSFCFWGEQDELQKPDEHHTYWSCTRLPSLSQTRPFLCSTKATSQLPNPSEALAHS